MSNLPTIGEPQQLADTHYGIRVGWFGDEGGLLAVGHHHPMRVVAAMNRHARTTAKLRNIADDHRYDLADAIRDLTYTWAIVLGPCLQPSFPDADELAWHAAHCERCDGAKHRANWVEIGHHEGARRAYPVTVWRG